MTASPNDEARMTNDETRLSELGFFLLALR